MKTWYPKATPKIHNHNPILHSSFYDNRERFSSIYHSTMYKTTFELPSSLPRRSSLGRAAARSFQTPAYMSPDRLYKNRPKETYSNPITGVVLRFSNTMPLPTFDGTMNKPPITMTSFYQGFN